MKPSLTLTGRGPDGALPTGTTNWGYTLSSYATLRDRITITGVPPAYLRFTYALDGLRTATSAGGVTNLAPGGRVYFGAVQSATSFPLVEEVYVSKEDGNGSRAVPVAYAGYTDVALVGPSPLTVFLGLLATGTINSLDPGAVLSGAVDADFSHTLTWGVRAFDASGRDVTRAAGLVFASTVPEPATLALAGLGMALLLGYHTRGAAPRRWVI